MTTNDHENYFRSNAALEMASQPIVVIDFLGDICGICRDVGPGQVPRS